MLPLPSKEISSKDAIQQWLASSCEVPERSPGHADTNNQSSGKRRRGQYSPQNITESSRHENSHSRPLESRSINLAHLSARPSLINVDPELLDSVSQPAHDPTLQYNYERRPRRKTREDRYDLQEKSKRKVAQGNTQARKRTKTRKGREKPGTVLMERFAAPNISSDRLTLMNLPAPGLFGKGRASSPTRRKGVSDLVFSELDFLNAPKHTVQTAAQGHSIGEGIKRKGRNGGFDKEADISQYFTASASRRSTQPIASNDKEVPIELPPNPCDLRSLTPPSLPEKSFLGFGGSGRNTQSSVLNVIRSDIEMTASNTKGSPLPQNHESSPLPWSSSNHTFEKAKRFRSRSARRNSEVEPRDQSGESAAPDTTTNYKLPSPPQGHQDIEAIGDILTSKESSKTTEHQAAGAQETGEKVIGENYRDRVNPSALQQSTSNTPIGPSDHRNESGPTDCSKSAAKPHSPHPACDTTEKTALFREAQDKDSEAFEVRLAKVLQGCRFPSQFQTFVKQEAVASRFQYPCTSTEQRESQRNTSIHTQQRSDNYVSQRQTNDPIHYEMDPKPASNYYENHGRRTDNGYDHVSSNIDLKDSLTANLSKHDAPGVPQLLHQSSPPPRLKYSGSALGSQTVFAHGDKIYGQTVDEMDTYNHRHVIMIGEEILKSSTIHSQDDSGVHPPSPPSPLSMISNNDWKESKNLLPRRPLDTGRYPRSRMSDFPIEGSGYSLEELETFRADTINPTSHYDVTSHSSVGNTDTSLTFEELPRHLPQKSANSDISTVSMSTANALSSRIFQDNRQYVTRKDMQDFNNDIAAFWKPNKLY